MTGSRNPRVCVITNIVPHYRVSLYNSICRSEIAELSIFCQNEIPGINLESNASKLDAAIEVSIVPYVSMKRESLAWQFLPLRFFFRKWDAYLLTANPRVVSTVVYSLILKLLGRRVVGWAQLHSGRSNKLLERLKLYWWNLLDGMFVYTDAEAIELAAGGYRGIAVGMNNGLDQDRIDSAILEWPRTRLEQWQRQADVDPVMTILSCARLDSKNAFELVPRAMSLLRESHPRIRWVVIGDGPERSSIGSLVDELGLGDRVRFVGSIYEEIDLAPWFLSAVALAHPGKIGLSLLHAFGYGCPVITNDNVKSHTPEIAAFTDGKTGLFYEHGSISSLAEALAQVLDSPNRRDSMAREAQRRARNDFNVRVMTARFQSLIGAVVPR